MIGLANKKELLLRWLPLLALLVCISLCLSGCQKKELFSDFMIYYDEEYSDQSGCWGCLIFEVLFNAINDMINALYPMVVEGCRRLLAVLFALWILYKVGNMFFSFKQPDTAAFWSEFARMCVAIVFCVALLTSKETLFYLIDYTLIPVFEGAINIGVAIVEQSFTHMALDGFGNTSMEANYASCAVAHTSSPTGSNIALDVGMKDTMTCMIFEMHKRLTYAYFFAYKLIVQWDWAPTLLGIYMLVTFFIISLVFPFYLVDGIFRVGIVFIILPILVVFWPFKPLRQYATAAWKLSLGAFVQVTMMVIFVTLIVEIVIDFTLVAVERLDGISEYVALNPGTDVADDFISNNVASPEKLFFMFFIAVYALLFIKKVSRIAAHMANSTPQPTYFAEATGRMAKMALQLAQMNVRLAKLAHAKGKNIKAGGK